MNVQVELKKLNGEAKLIKGLLAVAIAQYPVTAAVVAFALGVAVAAVLGHLF